MALPLLTFYILAFVIISSAVMVIAARNAITSALFLALSLISVGAMYISLHAEFLFAVQILVYTGGIMVLFLFVIMLVNVDELAQVRRTIRAWWLPAALVMVSFLALMKYSVAEQLPRAAESVTSWGVGSNTRAVSALLFSEYLLPFEIVSIVLLVAMLGAIMLAKKEI